MIAKTTEKNKAILLRKKGYTYSEILKVVPVAKSTLSLWLKEVGLSRPQIQRITRKRLDAGKRGGEMRRRNRIENTNKIKKIARKEVQNISKNELWLIGTALYWAEGYKEKAWSGGVGLDFANSDPRMIKLFLRWLYEILEVSQDRVTCRIAVHENNKYRLDEIEKYWLNVTSLPLENFRKVNFKRHTAKTVRKNIGRKYYGLLQVRVKKSTDLNRKIDGWIEGISRYYKLDK